MRTTILIIVGFLLFACEQEITDSNNIVGKWQLQIEMFDNSTTIGRLSGNIDFRNNDSAVFTDSVTLEETLYSWSNNSEALHLINKSTGFAVSYDIKEQSRHHILLSYGTDVKMNLFR